MYHNFTQRARKVMQLANQEAQRFNHEYIGTEHFLLGLVEEGSGVAAKVLKNLGIDLRTVRLDVERIVQAGFDMVTMGRLPETPRGKKVIDYSIEEARNLRNNYVCTEHLLLGLLREKEGVAAQVLMNLGLQLEDVREHVHLLQRGCDFPQALMRGLPRTEKPDLPPETRVALAEVDVQIEQINQQKEAAVAKQDFESAAHLRDEANKLKKRKESIPREWHTRYPIDPSWLPWLSWNDSTVVKMAGVIYEEQRWNELPILADALEEAGCTVREILDHCRLAGPHARLCWVLVLLLGKM